MTNEQFNINALLRGYIPNSIMDGESSLKIDWRYEPFSNSKPVEFLTCCVLEQNPL